MTADTTRKILKSVDDLGKLPPTISKVLDVAKDPSASPKQLAAVLRMDPVLTFEILKLINSAFYSLRNEVTNLAQAVVLLGMNTVKNLCLSIALAEKLTAGANSSALSPDRFWEHSMRVAIAARIVAAECMKPPSREEDYFIAGLLHDMGKLVLVNLLPAEYKNLLVQSAQENMPLESLEESNFGITHSQVGAKIGEKWNFSPGFIDAVLGHHTHALAEDARYRRIQIVVSVANHFVHYLEDRDPDGETPPDPPPGAAPETDADEGDQDGETDEHRAVPDALYEEIGTSAEECRACLQGRIDEEFERAKVFLDTISSKKKK